MKSKLIQITAAIAAMHLQVIDLANSLQTDIETLENNFHMPVDVAPLITTSDTAIVDAVIIDPAKVEEKIPQTFMGEIISDIKKVVPFGSSFI